MTRSLLFTAGVALLACSLSASAQSSRNPRGTIQLQWTGGAAKPECVYRAVMSDAEIAACTGRPVRYDYQVASKAKVSPVASSR